MARASRGGKITGRTAARTAGSSHHWNESEGGGVAYLNQVHAQAGKALTVREAHALAIVAAQM
ncbi:MAG TPA: hypothetical protein VKE51_08695 [Vicinamibacterales bacterium]|nr:hypothetical protein [Vicinamibacterales bacterium]